MPRPSRNRSAATLLSAALLLAMVGTAHGQSSPPPPAPRAAEAPEALGEADDYAGKPETDPGAEAVAEPMTLARLEAILRAVDPGLESNGAMFRLKVGEVQAIIVTDARADRMRILVPVRPAEGLGEADLQRMMQANFDSALDARYAIARGTLWSAFIHPLSPLGRDEFLSGLGQTVNLATSYGGLYASGGLIFQGGDSAPLQKALIEDLLKKGEDL